MFVERNRFLCLPDQGDLSVKMCLSGRHLFRLSSQRNGRPFGVVSFGLNFFLSFFFFSSISTSIGPAEKYAPSGFFFSFLFLFLHKWVVWASGLKQKELFSFLFLFYPASDYLDMEPSRCQSCCHCIIPLLRRQLKFVRARRTCESVVSFYAHCPALCCKKLQGSCWQTTEAEGVS